MASIEVKTQSDKGKKWSNQGTLANILTQLKEIANDAGEVYIKETSPIVNSDQGVWLSAWAGGVVKVHIAKTGKARYTMNVVRPAGRKGIAEGTKEVRRHISWICDGDFIAFMSDPQGHPEGIEVEPFVYSK